MPGTLSQIDRKNSNTNDQVKTDSNKIYDERICIGYHNPSILPEGWSRRRFSAIPNLAPETEDRVNIDIKHAYIIVEYIIKFLI